MKRLYSTAAWQRARRRVLAAEPLCRACGRQGRVTAATEVDHITPLAAGGAAYDTANLQPLCRPCHSAKTRRDEAPGADICPHGWLLAECGECRQLPTGG